MGEDGWVDGWMVGRRGKCRGSEEEERESKCCGRCLFVFWIFEDCWTCALFSGDLSTLYGRYGMVLVPVRCARWWILLSLAVVVLEPEQVSLERLKQCQASDNPRLVVC